MANQLRYPNSHTYYFSYTILYLFSEQSKDQVKEQISRVLMERLIVNRPHPWGLLMTSAELLRNPIYRFWDHGFARCHKDMEKYVAPFFSCSLYRFESTWRGTSSPISCILPPFFCRSIFLVQESLVNDHCPNRVNQLVH